MLPLTVLFFCMLATSPAAAEAVTPAPGPTASPAPAWLAGVDAGIAGSFPLTRPYDATYRLSWAGVNAARAQVNVSIPAGTQLQTRLTASSTGMARTLYQMDATHTAVADARTLHPLWFETVEKLAHKQARARVDFSPDFATRTTEDSTKPGEVKSRQIHYAGMFDMHAAVLFLRSLPLTAGDTRSLIVMTGGAPYLATIKVVGRGSVSVPAGEFPAIELELALRRINKHGELEPHKGFKSAHAWLSDDANRLLVKIDAQVFVGAVSLELEKVTFAPPAAR